MDTKPLSAEKKEELLKEVLKNTQEPYVEHFINIAMIPVISEITLKDLNNRQFLLLLNALEIVVRNPDSKSYVDEIIKKKLGE